MRLRVGWIWTLAAAAALFAAGRADAFNIVFNGPSGFGIDAATAANAEAAGVPILDVESLQQAAALHLVIPDPDVLSFDISSSPSVANPNKATSRWEVDNAGGTDLRGTWLVFLNPVTYTATKIGFEIDGDDGWAVFDVFVPAGTGGTDYFYPAVFLGDIDSGDSVNFLMHHLVGQKLHQQGSSTLVLPHYSVAALAGRPIPEPALLGVLAAGLALAACAVRRNA
jgi:hypothetical protein